MHSVRQGPSVDLRCVPEGQQEKSEADRVKMLWDQGRAEPYETASAPVSCASHTPCAKDFPKPASGWMSCPHFETRLTWRLIVLSAFERFSGVTKLNTEERRLECCDCAKHHQKRKEDGRFEGLDASSLSRSTSRQRCASLC